MDRPASQTEQDVRPRDVSGETAGTYLELGPDGTLTAYCGKVELGTGLATAMAQIVAEGIGVPVDAVRMVMGDTALTPDQGTTAGSKSVQLAGPVLRAAALAAREELLERASARLEVSPRDLVIEGGSVRPVDRSSAGIPLGDLATGPFTRPVGEPQATVSDPRSGSSTPRVDLVGKLTGAPAFVHDLTLPGMLHGRVVRPWLATLDPAPIETLDDSEARAMPGGVAVVRRGGFLGVVAEREEEAARAAEALQAGVTWRVGEPLPPLETFQRDMRDAVDEVREVAARGDADGAIDRADRVLRASWTFPFVAHASLGPSCAVADVRDGRATVWCSTQGPYALRRTLAPLLGLPEAAVRVVHREGAGCYGHNGADDVAADAALLAQAAGRPVRVQWSRQQEFAWEPKSPAMVIDMAAGLDAEGGIVAWTHDTWTPTHATRPNGSTGYLLAGRELDPEAPVAGRYVGGDRNAPVTYAFPESRTTAHWVGASPLRPSALRSLGGTHNTTANEIFLDEIAHATGADPVALRLRWLDDPRAVAVVEAAAERAGWGEPVPAIDGVLVGRGFAFVRYELEYTYVATVADVAVDPASGEARVTRVFVAHDCGRIVNPDGVLNQVEGNVVQGVSRALKERVTWDAREVTSLTWAEYPILAFPEVPAIEVVLIDRPGEPSLGAGEAAICTVPAAVGNAIFAATGARLRSLPFTPDRVLAALSGR